MQIKSIATHYKFCPSNATTIVSTDGIIVHGILCDDAGLSVVTIREGNGTTNIGFVRFPAAAAATFEVRTPFVAKNGLSILTTAVTTACVFYSSLGN